MSSQILDSIQYFHPYILIRLIHIRHQFVIHEGNKDKRQHKMDDHKHVRSWTKHVPLSSLGDWQNCEEHQTQSIGTLRKITIN